MTTGHLSNLPLSHWTCTQVHRNHTLTTLWNPIWQTKQHMQPCWNSWEWGSSYGHQVRQCMWKCKRMHTKLQCDHKYALLPNHLSNGIFQSNFMKLLLYSCYISEMIQKNLLYYCATKITLHFNIFHHFLLNLLINILWHRMIYDSSYVIDFYSFLHN